MRSTLFLNYITCIDHAFIDQNGMVIGGSYHPIFEVTGDVETNEQVVVDFSKLKKQIKSIVDDSDNGFDHKLIFINGLSGGNLVSKRGVTKIDSSRVSIEAPDNAIKIVESNGHYSIDMALENAIAKQVEAELSVMYPGIKVKCKLTEHHFSNNKTTYLFRYVHGLKDSSSWGCQNIAHGHLSFISFDSEDKDNEIFEYVFEKLDKKIFVFRENMTMENGRVVIEYVNARGHFKMTAFPVDCIILDTETTIENIIAHVVKEQRELFKKSNVGAVYISEGLAKGSVMEVY